MQTIKEMFVGALVLLGLVFVFGPWALLLVDGSWLFLTGHVLTSVPWESNRVMLAVVWPFLCMLVAMIFAGG